MTGPALLELIHAEIDGELDAKQAAELARGLLADPGARALRDELRRLCAALDAIAHVEPPPALRESILAALPHSTPLRPRSGASTPGWRYAALFAGVLAAGAVVYQSVHGPRPAATEAAGTMASGVRTTLDSVRLGPGPVSGQVSLFRDRAGLGLEFELVASARVEALVTGDGRTLRITGLGRQDDAEAPRTVVALPGFKGGAVKVTFLIGGGQVGSATLQVPEAR